MNHSLRFQILALAAARTVLNTMHRMVYPFLPTLSRGLGVELPALSLALTARALLGTTSPLLTSVADSRGRKAGLLLGLGLFSTGVTLVAIWPTYPVFVLALILAALGKYVYDPSMQAYLGDRVPYQQRGLAVALTELSWSFAFILGIPFASFLIARSGWMAPFPLLAVLGLLAMAWLAWLLPADPAAKDGQPGLLLNLRTVLSYRPALAGLLVGVWISAANEVVNLIFGVWMEESFGLKIATLGAASAVIGLSELGGESLVGVLVDRLGKARAVVAGLVLNSLAVLLLPLFAQSLWGALLGLFLFYITFEFALVSSIPLMTEILPSARATLMAGNVAGLSLGRALGASLAPPLYALGIFGSALAAVLFNLLALLSLRFVHISSEKQESLDLEEDGEKLSGRI